MKIAIISDSHDNIVNLDRVLDYLIIHHITNLVHCGDLTSRETLEYLIRKFGGYMYIAKGNAETFDEFQATQMIKKYHKVKFFDDIGLMDIDGVKIGITHKPEDIDKIFDKKPDYVFFGHTHKPDIKRLEVSGKTIIAANPGNITGQPYEATFAILNTKNNKLELVGLKN